MKLQPQGEEGREEEEGMHWNGYIMMMMVMVMDLCLQKGRQENQDS